MKLEYIKSENVLVDTIFFYTINVHRDKEVNIMCLLLLAMNKPKKKEKIRK